MEEKTDLEKETFGKIKLEELGDPNKDRISAITNFYIQQGDPKELLNQCVQKSREKFNREYSKLGCFFDMLKFYTDDGLKARAQSLKFKMFTKDKEIQNENDRNF